MQKQKMFDQITGWQLTALVAVTALVYPLVLLLPQNIVIALAEEDSIIENAGAVAYLTASVLSVAAYVSSEHDCNQLLARQTKRNVYFLLLAVFFFICFGEEISWGQRIFGWSTPEGWSDLNAQSETNFHNLWRFQSINPDGSTKSQLELFLYPGRLITLFWASYCVAVPMVYVYGARSRDFLTMSGLPIPSLAMAPLFITSYLSAKLFKDLAPDWAVKTLSELQEASFAALFALLALLFLLGVREDASSSARRREGQRAMGQLR
jgi:hypothetical protein